MWLLCSVALESRLIQVSQARDTLVIDRFAFLAGREGNDIIHSAVVLKGLPDPLTTILIETCGNNRDFHPIIHLVIIDSAENCILSAGDFFDYFGCGIDLMKSETFAGGGDVK